MISWYSLSSKNKTPFLVEKNRHSVAIIFYTKDFTTEKLTVYF